MSMRINGVEAFTTPAALQESLQRRQAAEQSIRRAAFRQGQAVVIGGAGFTAHGMDTFVGEPDEFDVDAVVNDELFVALSAAVGIVPQTNELHVPRTAISLPMTILRGPLPGSVVSGLGARTFDELAAKAVVVNGIPTLSPGALAHSKLHSRADIKDFGGIAKAQTVAWATGNEVVNDPNWRSQVVNAMRLATNYELYNRGLFRSRSGLPPWLGRLVASGFDHPAFDSIIEEQRALRRAA